MRRDLHASRADGIRKAPQRRPGGAEADRSGHRAALHLVGAEYRTPPTRDTVKPRGSGLSWRLRKKPLRSVGKAHSIAVGVVGQGVAS
ncbi:hypothetical protein [Streptomyces sp. Ag109_O5-1]|uniref:hypothetical protein n=1 Tax=Streptomyces sp. Ag109_O5-1 TaxID=1938851 RepID=UPI000F4E2535|nr:hypothetical protein [Streptomyces sp. Ag109_O5-1]